MSIDEVVAKRNISSVLHFTTNRGLLGILATKTLKSRLRLNKDEHLKHIFQPNATCRDKDKAWLDYVNLSISRINMGFFNTSSKSWHSEKNFWWSVLDFSPKILNHQGVNFTTTNNIYTGVLRKTGHDGLEAMFADRINQWLGKDIIRPRALDAKFPTCLQAE
ncbi:DarT ssDNA thymidine ADP-ribosyltransferase family protein [Raoultella ornithinolytica]|uniref:DarT ssDNA thymidine ADP-ribosyltransferase family protein n=1 Tax=Raoultella ornithinolytica TaxID=54291 RepID=UPI0013F40986|nr:DarT ssDNA thymidine ADP-ribosyltransferase family protein [Raoultella ornithinolytica]QIJ50297.1 DUF4433 domain-containing protein [Raoultella ornithinolytica]